MIFNGIICAYKKDSDATQKSIKIAIKNAKRKGNKYPSESAIFAAGYVFVFTSLDEGEMATEDVLRFYRMRWQIEIYFKKLKSQFDVGRPPSESPASLDAWIHGKILATLLVEGFADSAKPFPPQLNILNQHVSWELFREALSSMLTVVSLSLSPVDFCLNKHHMKALALFKELHKKKGWIRDLNFWSEMMC